MPGRGLALAAAALVVAGLWGAGAWAADGGADPRAAAEASRPSALGAELHLDAGRKTPITRLVSGLATCVQGEDYGCMDQRLAGSELVTRLAARRLAGQPDDPDVLPSVRADAVAGGRRRYLKLLRGPLGQCEAFLSMAGEGVCRDEGAVRRPRPERDLPPGQARWAGALARLDRTLGAGLRHRRAHRLICGPYADLGGIFRYAEGVVVVADRPRGTLTVLDLACRTLGAGGVTHLAPVALPPVPAAPDSAPVVAAVSRAIHCLEDGGTGCLDAVSPLDRLLHGYLVRQLNDTHDAREQVLDEVGGIVTGDLETRAGWLLSRLHDRCGDLRRLAADDCRAGAPVPVPPLPHLPHQVDPSEVARVRALEAIVRARVPQGPLEARPLACGDLRATAILVRPAGGLPALVDLSCR